MTIRELKNILEDALQKTEQFDDNDEVCVESNTYYVDGEIFLSVAGEGFVDLENLHLEEPEPEEDDDVDEEADKKLIADLENLLNSDQ